MKTTKALILLAVFLMSLMTTPVHASSAGMHVSGPSVAAMNTNVTYHVQISGIFDVYKCTLLIAGQNLSGASPLNQSGVMQTNHDGNFVFTVKTPNATQTMYLDFKGYGIVNSTGKVKIFERRIALEIKKSFTIVANVKNVENYTLYNITVVFYIDGNRIGDYKIDKITANSTKEIKYVWVPDVHDGAHKLTIKLIGKGVIFANNQREITKEIYVGTPPNYDWIWYLGIATLSTLAVLFIFMFFGRKKGTRKAEPKWKK